ncbi:MAG: magnesium transporter, partial [Campylobacterota bacterium]|nr:magnesium transporter [Campylobacterota bacterium]
MMKKKDIKNLSSLILNEIAQYKLGSEEFHPYDMSEQLIDLRQADEKAYLKVIKKVPHELLADVLVEMPDHVQEEISELLSTKKLADVTSKMDSDDAADFIQNVSESSENTAQNILDNIDDEERKEIEELIAYDEDVAGAFMQKELFSATLDETIGDSIKRLKQLKQEDEVDHIFHAHIVNKKNKYICSIGLEEVIIMDHNKTYRDIFNDEQKEYTKTSAHHKEDVDEIIELVTKYNMTAIPIIDDNGILLGRITSDDVYDLIEERATEQIYNLAGVDDEAEQDEDLFEIGKHRAMWLGLNLITAIAASIVIGLFDTTIQSMVALAILLPIVASMGGNAGTQTLTVTVRQLALGDIEKEDAKQTIYKEVILSLANGAVFAVVIGIIAYFWFNIPLLGVVI